MSLSYSNFENINYFTDTLPTNQTYPSEKTDTYKFERMRLGKQMVTLTGEKFGPYLYRNNRTGVLIASWDIPQANKTVYMPSDIGMYSDALIYYKNQ